MVCAGCASRVSPAPPEVAPTVSPRAGAGGAAPLPPETEMTSGSLGPDPLPRWPPRDPPIDGPCPVPFVSTGWMPSNIPPPAGAKQGDLLGFQYGYPELVGASGELVTLSELYRQRTGLCDVNRDWGKFLGFAGENSGPTFVDRHGGKTGISGLLDTIKEVRALACVVPGGCSPAQSK